MEMNQLNMADFANYTANIPTKGKVKPTGEIGSKKDQETLKTSDFNELLQEKEGLTDLTKEQEQVLSAFVSGMQIVNNLVTPQMPEEATKKPETASIPFEDFTSGAVNVQMVKQVQAKMRQLEESQDTTVEMPKELQPQVMENNVILEGEETTLEGEKLLTKFPEKVMEKNQPKESREVSEQLENKAVETVQTGQAGFKFQDLEVETDEKIVSKEGTQSKFYETMKVRSPEEIPQTLAEKIIDKSAKGVRKFEIQIEPKNLGKMAVKLEYQNGEATISIVCTEAKTLELVKKNVNDIRMVVQRNLQEDMVVFVDEKKAETFEQQGNGNSDAGRESEWERQREKRRRETRANENRFLQELRLGLNV